MQTELTLDEKVFNILQNTKIIKDAYIINDIDVESIFLDTKLNEEDEKIIFSLPINYKIVKKLYIDFYSVFTIGYIENPNIFFSLRECIYYDDYWNIGTLNYSPSLFNLICYDISYYEKLIILESEESELPDFSKLSI